MLLLTIKRAEFVSHLEARIKIHTARDRELVIFLSELRAIAKKIRKDMKQSARRAQRVLQVKGRQYQTIFALGITGSYGAAGPAGPAGQPGPSGDCGYMEFDSETELLGKLEAKEREFARERDALNSRIRKFGFYRTHLPAPEYNLNVEEVQMLEFT